MPNKHTRLANLRLLIKREGAVSQLALRLQISPIYIYRVLDGKFNIGDSMARKIEDAYGFAAGWMDGNHEGAESAEVHIPTLETAQRVAPPARETPAAPTIPTLEPAATPPPAEPPVRQAAAPLTAAPAAPSAPALAEPPSPAPTARPGDEEVRQRVVAAIVNTMDRLLVANNVEMSDLEKARLLMRAAEAILDGSAASRPAAGPQKSFLKIS